MYTGKVVRLRLPAFIVALALAMAPVLGVACRMDCEQVPATSICHGSTGSPDGSTVRNGQHACSHDHSTGNPAFLPSGSARDYAGTAVVLPVTTTAYPSVADARLAIPAMHGPPGSSGRSSHSIITILRI